MDIYEARDTAAALYDGGWRSDDADELQIEYDFTDNELADVIASLKEIESNDADWLDE